MNTEQKSNAYDRALKEAVAAYKDEDKHLKATLERIFPELKESEDEKVKRCLINGMKFYCEDNEEATWGTEKFSMKVKDILSWLEKQSEQKPTEWGEEDEYNLQCMIAKVTSDIQKGNAGRNNELIDWLKSLKQKIKEK